VATGQLQLETWEYPRRAVFAQRLQGVVRSDQSRQFWDASINKCAAHGTELGNDYTPWQIQQLYSVRSDTENVFDELKKQ
jgi:hypothetical protein